MSDAEGRRSRSRSRNTLVIMPDGSVPFTGDQSLGGHKLTDLGAPVNPNDASRKVDIDCLEPKIDDIILELEHETFIFPEATNLTVDLGLAGAAANAWSAWTEIVDSAAPTPNKFSDKFATKDGHISAAQAEEATPADQVFMLEIGYGDEHVIISRARFISGATPKLSAIQQQRIRPLANPAGEKVYYRLMCDDNTGACKVNFRYHYED